MKNQRHDDNLYPGGIRPRNATAIKESRFVP
jgi:hypothetical protein